MVFHRNKILILWLFQASLTQVVTSCVARSPTNRRSSRQPFYLHQQVPNIDEFSQGASGPPGEPIKYGTSAYKRLNTNYNPGIVFEHVQEKSGDTRRMSKRCMDALNKLEKSVKERWDWGKVKVRVIAAWDEETYHKHDTHSLHYEGRAVDITTSDRDRSKMGVLARLAVEAGFDWVRYIQKYKVHASCRADGKRDPNLMGMGCFRSNSTVQLEDGTTKEMARLRIGDRVQSVDKEGRIIYSDIVMFLDNKPNKKDVLYFVLKTENPQTELYITKSHLLYVRRRFSNLWEVLFAKVVQKGDYINVFTEGKLLPAKVMDILVIPQQGAIAPLTSEGNIIVDGVLASCYALLDDQEFVNSIFWPAKALYRFFPSLLNASNKPQEGVHWYARLLIFLNNYISVLT